MVVFCPRVFLSVPLLFCTWMYVKFQALCGVDMGIDWVVSASTVYLGLGGEVGVIASPSFLYAGMAGGFIGF